MSNITFHDLDDERKRLLVTTCEINARLLMVVADQLNASPDDVASVVSAMVSPEIKDRSSGEIESTIHSIEEIFNV